MKTELWPHSKKVPRSSPKGLSVLSLHVLLVLVWVSCRCLGFYHNPKTCRMGGMAAKRMLFECV